MTILRVCSETEELGGGRFRHVQHMRPVAYLRDGAMRRMGYALADSADPDMPLGVDEAMLFKCDPRIAGKSPLFEIRAPDRTKLARFALLNANNVAAQQVRPNEWVYPNALNGADLAMVYAGHYVAADFRLRTGHPGVVSWRMDDQAGFDPVRMMLGNMTIRQPMLLPPEGSLDVASVPLVWKVSEEAGRYRLDCALPAGDWAGWTLDPTLTLQPDAAAGQDAWIVALPAWQTNNAGIAAILLVGAMSWGSLATRSLLKFDLSGLPAAATITSAVLSLWVYADFSTNARTVRVYRLKRAWVEGDKNNATDAPASGATWIRYDTVNNWQTAGGSGANDREAVSIGSCAMGAAEAPGTQKDFVLTPTTKADLDLGNGWMIQADTENSDGYYFESSDSVTPGIRPKLVVEYTLPGGGNIFQSAIMRSAIYGGTLVR